MNIFYFFLKHKKTALFLIFLTFVISTSVIGNSFKNPPSNPSIPTTPIPLNSSTSGSKIPIPEIKSSPLLQTSQLGTVTFSLSNVSFPASLTTYKVLSYGIDPAQAQNIAKSFSLNTPPQIIDNNLYVWVSEDTTKSLSAYLDSGLLIYTNSLIPGQGDTSISIMRSDSDIKRVAENFLQKQTYLGKDLTIDKILYHKGEEISQPVKDISSATFFEVTLKRTINSIPIFYQYATSDSASVIISSLGIVRKFSYVFLSYQPFDNRQLLPIEEAKQKIQNGEGTIVSYGDNHGADVSSLLSTNINSVELAYLNDNTTGFLSPIFVFTGTANSPTSTNVPIVIYLPALR